MVFLPTGGDGDKDFSFHSILRIESKGYFIPKMVGMYTKSTPHIMSVPGRSAGNPPPSIFFLQMSL
jgi:hypothetical protein